MKARHYIILAVVLLISVTGVGQLNIQTGYDIGFINYKLLTEGNRIDQINLNTELKLKRNILISFDYGFDTHNRIVKGESSYFTDNSQYIREYGASQTKYYVSRFNLALGYEFKINSQNSITTKISSGISNIRRIRILESIKGKQIFTSLDGDLLYEEVSFQDTKDKEKYSYPDDFISTINPLTLGIEYRYKLKKISLNGFFGYSPFKAPFLTRNNINNLFMIGFRIGYEIPFSKQKS